LVLAQVQNARRYRASVPTSACFIAPSASTKGGTSRHCDSRATGGTPRRSRRSRHRPPRRCQTLRCLARRRSTHRRPETKRTTVEALFNCAARRSGGHRGLLATDDAASVRPRLLLCLRRTPPR